MIDIVRVFIDTGAQNRSNGINGNWTNQGLNQQCIHLSTSLLALSYSSLSLLPPPPSAPFSSSPLTLPLFFDVKHIWTTSHSSSSSQHNRKCMSRSPSSTYQLTCIHHFSYISFLFSLFSFFFYSPPSFLALI